MRNPIGTTLKRGFTGPWPLAARPETIREVECSAALSLMPSWRSPRRSQQEPTRHFRPFRVSRLWARPGTSRRPVARDGGTRSAAALVTLDADAQDVVRLALPPVLHREDLDLAVAAIAGSLDPAANAPDVDDAVAHHRAVEQEVARRPQPVADVEGEDTTLMGAGAGNLRLETRIPPGVINVDVDAEPGAERVAEIVGLGQRVDASAVGGVHRVERLDGQLHAGLSRVRQQRGDAVADDPAGAGDVARAGGEAADDEHQALRADRRRLLDGAAVVVACAVARAEHAAAAEAGDGHAVIGEDARRLGNAAFGEAIAPWRDGADAVTRQRLDGLAQRQRLQRRRVDRQERNVAREITHRRRAPSRSPACVPSQDPDRRAARRRRRGGRARRDGEASGRPAGRRSW